MTQLKDKPAFPGMFPKPILSGPAQKTAPPVYRPAPVSPVQAKMSAPPVYRPAGQQPMQAKLAAPPVYRPGAAALVQAGQTAPPVYRPASALSAQAKMLPPSVYRPGNQTTMQAFGLGGPAQPRISPTSFMPASVVAPPPRLQPPPSARQSFVLQMDPDDEMTDDEEVIEDARYSHIDTRAKLKTIYSYAVTPSGKPSAGPGPHTVPDCLHRYSFDKMIEGNDLAGLESVYHHLPDEKGLRAIVEEEVASKDVRSRLDQQYYSDYTASRTEAEEALKLAKKDPKDKALMKSAGLAVFKQDTLHPYAAKSWRAGNKCSKKSSDGKGEKVRLRPSGIPSVRHSRRLYDGGASAFNNKEASSKHHRAAIKRAFGSEAKAKRAYDYHTAAEKRKRELVEKWRKESKKSSD